MKCWTHRCSCALIFGVVLPAITIRTNHQPSNHSEDNAVKLAMPPSRTAQDKFHARLLLANCVPLSIKFIFFPSQSSQMRYFYRFFFFSSLNANHRAFDIFIHSRLWQQRLARRHDDWNQISYLLTCLRAQIARLASNQYLALGTITLWNAISSAAWGFVCKVFFPSSAWFRLSIAIIRSGRKWRAEWQFGDTHMHAHTHTHATAMITFMVPIDFLMTLWLVIFPSNLCEMKLAVHLKVMISLSCLNPSYFFILSLLPQPPIVPAFFTFPPTRTSKEGILTFFFFKSHFLALVQSPSLRDSGTQMSNSQRRGWVSTLAPHIYWQRLASNKMRGVWCDTGSFLRPDKCTIISLQTQHSAVTVLWEEEIK